MSSIEMFTRLTGEAAQLRTRLEGFTRQATTGLRAEKLGRGTAWLDAGTPDSLLQAGNFVQTVQERQGLQLGCPEEIAFRRGFLDAAALRARGTTKTAYGRYLLDLADGKYE